MPRMTIDISEDTSKQLRIVVAILDKTKKEWLEDLVTREVASFEKDQPWKEK